MVKPRWGEKATWLLMVILKFGTLSLPQMVKRNLVYFSDNQEFMISIRIVLRGVASPLNPAVWKTLTKTPLIRWAMLDLWSVPWCGCMRVKSSWCCACKYWGCCTDAPSCSRDHQQVSYMFLFVGYYFLYPSFCNVSLCQGPRVVDMHWSRFRSQKWHSLLSIPSTFDQIWKFTYARFTRFPTGVWGSNQHCQLHNGFVEQLINFRLVEYHIILNNYSPLIFFEPVEFGN